MISYIFDYILELFCGSVASKKIEKDGTFKAKPTGFGERQSPINIVTGSVVTTQNMPPLSCSYDPASVNVVNTGSSWKMDFTADRTNLSGGPLEGNNYKIIQMHAHWGKKGGKGGSEHTIDGKKYDGELHLVHLIPSTGTSRRLWTSLTALLFLECSSRRERLTRSWRRSAAT